MTLYYTPSQVKIFRAVAGAVRNAADGHPNWPITDTMAHSIAKRATGTITSQWRDVLAANGPSEKAPVASGYGARELLGAARPRRVRRGAVQTGLSGPKRPSPAFPRTAKQTAKLIRNRLGAMAGDARRAGNTAREAGLVEALRFIAKEVNP